MIISKKRFEAEVERRVDEHIKQIQENMWRDDRERDQDKRMTDLEFRLIEVEKKCGIDHPSHHNGVCVGRI